MEGTDGNAPERPGRRPRPPEPDCPVYVGAFGNDARYRLVWLRGIGWEPLAAEEFEPRVREVFPDIDFADPEQVCWADRPREWPARPAGGGPE